MNKSDLTVLRGGLLDSADTSRKKFLSAYVTNTRLMGVTGMYIYSELPDNKALTRLHQFFYFDAEEFGFETYQSILGDNAEKVKDIENSLIGGLGGEKVSVTLKEAQFLLQQYVRMNKEQHIPMPEGYSEYKYLLEENVVLNTSELSALMYKQCAEIDSVYEVINYFLMRCFSKDFEAASFLTTGDFDPDLFPDFKMAALCKNTITASKEPDTYLSESLVEWNDRYYIAVTCITLDNMRVSSFERISSFKITSTEAAMMLSRSEFISAYNIMGFRSKFTVNSTNLSKTAMVSHHDMGDLYMIFHPNNKHVASKEYRLNEDILGMYFVSNFGQLISAAYSLEEISKLENDLRTSAMGGKLFPVSKYEFQEPVLYEFIQSGFEDFEDFVDAIRTEE